jgi:hypothetical protein
MNDAFRVACMIPPDVTQAAMKRKKNMTAWWDDKNPEVA